MSNLIFLPPAKNFIKKLKDKKLKQLIANTIEDISCDYNIGKLKTGDLAGIYGYDIFYNKTNYEISYTVHIVNDTTVIIIMIGTRENFYNELKKYIKDKK